MNDVERAARRAQAEWDRKIILDYAAIVGVEVTDEPGGDLLVPLNELFLAARYPAETDSPAPCGAYSRGTDGWACAATGPHDQHRNAAEDVTWGDA